MNLSQNLEFVKKSIPHNVTLIVVSKTKSVDQIFELYNENQRHFGENKVQELCEKQVQLPKDIHWHLIGHLQTNKVKFIAPFVHLVHSVDSLKLLKEINKEAKKNKRIIDCLLQIYIAKEETKFGLSPEEAVDLLQDDLFSSLLNIRIVGIMGMASNVNDESQIRTEFKNLKNTFIKLKNKFFEFKSEFKEISMGMSGDYLLAIEEGSTLVRVGSLIFK
jgi:pyridoxal phosphate enzyme (YggS family)